MPRFARVMLEDWPFHLTHRGNHRNCVFRHDDDRRAYLASLTRFAGEFGMAIWAYCLMGNHVHLIAVGRRHASISKALGNTHRAYSRRRNAENDVTGHLWANRFHSTPLDDLHLWAAVRYVELNPVRAKLVRDATEYEWSSARAHVGSRDDPLLDPARPFPGPIGDWAAWLGLGLANETARRIRLNTSTGRPLCNGDAIERLEKRLGRPLPVRKRGPRAST